MWEMDCRLGQSGPILVNKELHQSENQLEFDHPASPTLSYVSSTTIRREVSTWRVRFAGRSSDLNIKQFFERIEWYAARSGIKTNQLLGVLDLCLEGEALHCFWINANRHPDATWMDLKDAMLLRFAVAHSDEDVLQMLRNRKQQYPKESIQEYYQAMQELAGQSGKRISDRVLYKILRRNMRPGLQMKLHDEWDFPSLTEFIQRCCSFETMWRRVGCNPEGLCTTPESPYFSSNFKSLASPQERFSPQQVHELTLPYTEQKTYVGKRFPEEKVFETNNYDQQQCTLKQQPKGVTQPSKIPKVRISQHYPHDTPHRTCISGFSSRDKAVPCFNCDSLTHEYLDCRQPVQRVFCYGCGRRDIFRPDCMRCNPPVNMRGEIGDFQEPQLRQPTSNSKLQKPTSKEAANNTDSTTTELDSLKLSKTKNYLSTSCQTDNRRVVRKVIYFRRRRLLRRALMSSVIHTGPDDRPYLDIKIQNVSIRGLLDSGANISVLGRGSEQFLQRNGLTYQPVKAQVHTASGAPEQIMGYVYVPVSFQGQTKNIRLYIAPSLAQTLYLGTDFWRAFGLQVTVSELTVVNQAADPPSNKDDQGLDYHVLSKTQQQLLDLVKEKFPSSGQKGLGHTHLVEHEIDTGDAKPIKQRYYAVSPVKQREMDQEIERMLALGVIEESSSPWSSPVTVVLKSNGKVRLCLDARKLNAVTVKEAYPLPIIDGLLGRLENTKYITSLDLKDAFWQIPLNISSRIKTAFTVPGRPLYHFRVMPFGLCNAAQTMCRLMHKVIPHELHDRVFVYLDDLLITSPTFEEHIQLLRIVAERLAAANLTINVEKSKFILKHLKYLGHIIGDGSIKVDPEKVKAIQDFPAPKTVKHVRQFLGMSGWYRKFIANFSAIASPLTDLLKSKKGIAWNEHAQGAFDKLKGCLSSAPVLVHPDYNRTFYIQVDASKTGVGGVIFQKDDDNEEHPIAFYSHKLNGAQKNYSVTELECLAAVLSVKKFRAYVEGYEFVIITDHASLQWLMNQTDLSGRLARWSLKLQGFNFRIEYRKGTQNVVPDTLSRIPSEEISALDMGSAPLGIDLQASEFSDTEYGKLMETFQNMKPVPENIRITDGKILIHQPVKDPDNQTDIPTWKLWLPSGLIPGVLAKAHEPPTSAHMGTGKMIEFIRRNFFWPTLGKDVKDYVRQCQMCKMTKASNVMLRPEMGQYKEYERPFQKLYLDFMGPYPRSKSGNSYIFIALDQYSKFVFLKPMREATASRVIDYLDKEVFPTYSVPEVVLTDNGKQFKANIFQDWLAKLGVQHMFTPVYSPQANASERVNRSVLAAIRAYVKKDQRTWDVHLPQIASALRNTSHSSTGFAPSYLVFGQHVITHGSQYKLLRLLGDQALSTYTVATKDDRLAMAKELVKTHLKQAHSRTAQRYNLRSTTRQLTEGQDVLVRNFTQSNAINHYSAKLDTKFIPAKVRRRIGQVAYELEDHAGKILGIFHCKDIRGEHNK